MNVNSQEIKTCITNNLIKDFPELHPLIEPKIKEKIQIQKKEVRVNAPVIKANVPKVFFFIK